MGRLRALGVASALGIALAVGCSSTTADAPICGASAPRQCVDQEPCAGDADCASGSCVGGACKTPVAPVCAADPRNVKPGEKLCDGQTCTAADQCVSAACTNSTCAPSPSKKCGVGRPDPCANGEPCQQDADCATDYCAGTCGPPAADVHTDGRRNGGETGIDCGGSALPDKTCPAGEACKTSDDCASTCTAGVCDAPSPTDGKKNEGETDIDCGGANAPKCALGKACLVNDDCIMLACTANACVKPTATDGIVNGGETDVDCGGAGVTEGAITYTAPRCKEGLTCAAGGDCVTGACAPTNKCSLPSCATIESAGITSCGKGETGDAAAAHESCCKSLVLPTRTTRRLDKYEITAGRMRTFLASAGPNVRAWVSSYVAAHPTSQLAQLMAAFPLLSIFPAADRFDALNLTAHMAMDIDNYGGIRGCYNGAGDYAANTYWQDPMHLADYGIPARSLPRSVSDEKSLNCAMPIMYYAFCAWDGGELATMADYHDVWAPPGPPNTYPWGATDTLRPNYNWCNGTYKNGGFLCQCDAAQNPSAGCNFAVNGEVGVFYEYPIGTDRSLDNEPLIAAPGRFVNDATVIKSGGESWYDIFANLAEYTGDYSANPNPTLNQFCDFSAGNAGGPTCSRTISGGTQVGTLYTNIPQVGVIGRTWEGHDYGYGILATNLPATFQYGKFGGRCVRPLP